MGCGCAQNTVTPGRVGIVSAEPLPTTPLRTMFQVTRPDDSKEVFERLADARTEAQATDGVVRSVAVEVPPEAPVSI